NKRPDQKRRLPCYPSDHSPAGCPASRPNAGRTPAVSHQRTHRSHYHATHPPRCRRPPTPPTTPPTTTAAADPSPTPHAAKSRKPPRRTPRRHPGTHRTRPATRLYPNHDPPGRQRPHPDRRPPHPTNQRDPPHHRDNDKPSPRSR